MSHRLSGTISSTDICHAPICQWPLQAIFLLCLLLVALTTILLIFCFFSSSLGLEGLGGAKMNQPPLVNRRSLEYKTDTPGSPVSDTFINVMKRIARKIWWKVAVFNVSNGKFWISHRHNFTFSALCFFRRLWATLIRRAIFLLLPLCTVTKDKEHTNASSPRQHG